MWSCIYSEQYFQIRLSNARNPRYKLSIAILLFRLDWMYALNMVLENIKIFKQTIKQTFVWAKHWIIFPENSQMQMTFPFPLIFATEWYSSKIAVFRNLLHSITLHLCLKFLTNIFEGVHLYESFSEVTPPKSNLFILRYF